MSFRVAFGDVVGDVSLKHVFERIFGDAFCSVLRNVLGTSSEMSLG